MLVEFVPVLRRGQAKRRGLYTTVQVARWLNERPKKERSIDHKQFTLEALARFVRGERIDNRFYMKRLRVDNEELWAIRIDTTPQDRIFGMFIEKDCFVCMNKRPRDELKNKVSRQWKSAEQKALNKWTKLFPGMRPMPGNHFSHYVSNGEHFDWKS